MTTNGLENANNFPSPQDLKGAALGTLVYVSLFITFISLQAFSKFYVYDVQQKELKRKTNDPDVKLSFKSVKYYNSNDRIALTGDRTVGNFVEYAYAFVSLLWIHAIFVNSQQSLTIALIYTFVRSYYPIVFWYGMPYLFLSTLPSYFILSYMMYGILVKFILA